MRVTGDLYFGQLTQPESIPEFYQLRRIYIFPAVTSVTNFIGLINVPNSGFVVALMAVRFSLFCAQPLNPWLLGRHRFTNCLDT